MKKTAFYCNHCGQLIEAKVYKPYINLIDEDGDFMDEQPFEDDLKDVHLCSPCAQALVKTINKKITEENPESKNPKRGRPKKIESEEKVFRDTQDRKTAVQAAMKKYNKAKENQ